MFQYAALNFGNADAQYNLARLYLDGADAVAKDTRQAIRWLALAADKGHLPAEALLGHLLFTGIEGCLAATRQGPDVADPVQGCGASVERHQGQLDRRPLRQGHGRGDRFSDREVAQLYIDETTANGTERAAGPFSAEVDAHRHVVGRLVEVPQLLVDRDRAQAVGRPGREQQVVDAQALVALPGAGLIVPEAVEAGLVGRGLRASIRPRLSRVRNRSRVAGRNRASRSRPAGRRRPAVRDHIVVARQDQRLLEPRAGVGHAP